MVDFKQMVYVQEKAQYEPRDEVAEGETILDISGTELRRRLQEGLEIPDWFSFPAVVSELRKSKPPRANQGFTVFFTGLSGSGKSTIANALMTKLMEMGGRPTTLLDGDIVRKHLSSELGFSKEHRDINIQRIGFVARGALFAWTDPAPGALHGKTVLITGASGFIGKPMVRALAASGWAVRAASRRSR